MHWPETEDEEGKCDPKFTYWQTDQRPAEQRQQRQDKNTIATIKFIIQTQHTHAHTNIYALLKNNTQFSIKPEYSKIITQTYTSTYT